MKVNIAIVGATGAVGGAVLKTLLDNPTNINSVQLFGRRPVEEISQPFVSQHKVDVTNSKAYDGLLTDVDVAICTLGVGQPSKVSKENFIKIDKTAVIDFGRACKAAGVRHFQLLSSVGVSANSSNFFLRTKGELVKELKALEFKRLSIFQPSMILTPTNRYGVGQAITLAVWPKLSPLLLGGLKKYRGVKVADLGAAIALNTFTTGSGYESLMWDDVRSLTK